MSVTVPNAVEIARTTPAPKRAGFSDRAVANLFVLPILVLLIGMNVFPLFWSLYLSFCKYKADAPKIAPVWVGNANYTEMLSRPEVWQSFRVTALFVLLAVGLQLLIGFGLALMLNRPFRLKSIVTTLFLLPMMLSSAVVGLFWKFLLDPTFGLVNFLLSKIGLSDPANPINWFDKDHALWSVVIADTWMWSPFIMLIALAGLSSVPATLYEAAAVDRASAWFRFRYITLPMIAPLLMVALLFRTLDSFKMFDLAWIMTAGGTANSAETVSIQVYREALRNWDTGRACALAYIVLLVIIGLTNLYLLLLNRVKGETSPDATPLFAGFGESPIGQVLPKVLPYLGSLLLLTFLYSIGGPVALGIAAAMGVFGALIFRLPDRAKTYLAYAGLTVALILSMLPLYWIVATSLKPFKAVNVMPPQFVFTPTFDNYAELIRPESSSARDFPGQLVNSLIIGVTSTVLAVGMGTLAAYAFSRFRIKAKNDALFFILSTRMLPPVVVAVPVFLMFRQLGLLNTHLGLILLYAAVNGAFAVWLMKGFTDDVPPEYEEAALLDRYTRLEAFRKTTLPLIVPGMAATAVFCFLNAWNEYALAQLLSTGKLLTAPPSITAVLGGGVIEWQRIAVRAVVFVIPAALFTFLMRKHLLRGLTFGAIKGR
ncbi:MAG: ABC transporter permease subunit [Capsulimonadales bacterium]|nr:ABC transporter permease subunit [Capsulimonadales bacterium]